MKNRSVYKSVILIMFCFMITACQGFKPIDDSGYTITWVVGDTIVETDLDVKVGSIPVFDGDVPKKESDEEFDYVFSGWQPELTAVTKDETYTAVFQSLAKKVLFQFETYDGNELDSIEFNIGDEIESLPEAFKFSYDFDGWYYDADLNNPVIYPYLVKHEDYPSITLYAKYKELSEGDVLDNFFDVFQKTIDEMVFLSLDFESSQMEYQTHYIVNNQILEIAYSSDENNQVWMIYEDLVYKFFTFNKEDNFIETYMKEYTFEESRYLENNHFASTLHGSSPGLVISFPYMLLVNGGLSLNYNILQSGDYFYIEIENNDDVYVFRYHVVNNRIDMIDAFIDTLGYQIELSIFYPEDQKSLIPDMPTDKEIRYLKNVEIIFSNDKTFKYTNVGEITIDMINDKYNQNSYPKVTFTIDQVYIDSSYTIPYDFTKFSNYDNLTLYIKL